MATAISASNLFLCCFLGRLATESYEKMSDCLYECKWYDHPVELQKNFILMILNAREPIYYSGFGIADLNLETFRKVRMRFFDSINWFQ